MPGAPGWGLGILICWAMPILVFPWAVQAMAIQLWQEAHPEDEISLINNFKAGWSYFPAYLSSLALVGLVAPLGILAFGVGLIMVVSLGIWRCAIVSLGLASGREATDRSWELAGPGGVLWTISSYLFGIILSAGAIALAQGLLGGVVALLAPPIIITTGTLLTVPAILDRIASQSN